MTVIIFVVVLVAGAVAVTFPMWFPPLREEDFTDD